MASFRTASGIIIGGSVKLIALPVQRVKIRQTLIANVVANHSYSDCSPTVCRWPTIPYQPGEPHLLGRPIFTGCSDLYAICPPVRDVRILSRRIRA